MKNVIVTHPRPGKTSRAVVLRRDRWVSWAGLVRFTSGKGEAGYGRASGRPDER